MNKYDALFFDFDGVIVDSVDLKTRALKKIFEPFGELIVKKVLFHHVNHLGVNRRLKMQYYYKEFLNISLKESHLNEICHQFSDLVLNEIVAAPEIPGVEEYLRRFYKKTPIFVISGAPEIELKKIISRRGLDIYFKDVFGSLVEKGSILLKLIRKYALTPENCLYYGDAESDYIAAKKCGVQFCAVVKGDNSHLLKIDPKVNWINNFLNFSHTQSNT